MISLPNDISISTDKSRLEIPLIYHFLSNSYWAKGRSLEMVKTSIEHSFCFGVYHNDRQIGFARVVSDCSVFGYLMDVFILETYRGQGLGIALMNYILQEPPLHNVQKWMLATKDAHNLYQKIGFSALENPEKWMQYVPKK